MSETKDPARVPDGVDLEHPNPARVYDWLLGGTANWAIDRAFGERAMETFPMIRPLARIGREFLGRGIQYIAEQGITQFLDLGSGVPTVGNVHEVADEVNPESRCVYVDNEPVAVAHAQVLLEREGDPARHAVLHGDLRDPDDIWRRAVRTGVLDPDEPLGLIVNAVLYFFGPDDRPHDIVARYRDLIAPGSYFLTSHMTEDGVPDEGGAKRAEVREQYNRSSSSLFVRTREEITRFFDGFDLVPPGVVWLPEWHLEARESKHTRLFLANPATSSAYGGLGRKP